MRCIRIATSAFQGFIDLAYEKQQGETIMRTLTILAVAGLSLAAVASTAVAQPEPQAAGTAPAEASPPPPNSDADPHVAGPYAGAGPHAFYDVSARIDNLQQKIASLPPGQGRRAASQLKAIKGELKYRMDRHNGELRDWDRELITKKLDQLIAQYPSLQS
jgi:hypothetical protein